MESSVCSIGGWVHIGDFNILCESNIGCSLLMFSLLIPVLKQIQKQAMGVNECPCHLGGNSNSPKLNYRKYAQNIEEYLDFDLESRKG